MVSREEIMAVASFKIQRSKGPKHFSSAVISSLLGVAGVFLLARAAWPYPQDRVITVAGIAVFLLLIAVELCRVWKIHQIAYPQAEAGDEVLTQTLNATMKVHMWANGGFTLLALAVFQFCLNAR
jgi:hypothetical protein